MRSLRSNSLLRALTILGLGAAGLVGGHTLGYAVSVPDAYHRSALLEATGHGYLPSASRLALMLGIAAVVTGIASGYLHRPRSPHPAFSRVAMRLVALQCAAFVGLEVVERVLASAPLSTLSLPIMLIGLVTQAVIAVALALLLVGLRRLGAVLRARSPVASVAGRSGPVVASEIFPFSRTRERERVRGPPAVRMV
jgi:hypothetical protein